MNQRDAVFNAVLSAVGGSIDGAVTLTKEQKEQVHTELVAGFVAGTIEFRGTNTEAGFRKYVPGLVNNWLRKDKRLNGGEKYIPKHPGSRAGSGDESLKAMKLLLSTVQDASARSDIEKEIEKRKLELKPKQEINVDALPESLRHLVAPKS